MEYTSNKEEKKLYNYFLLRIIDIWTAASVCKAQHTTRSYIGMIIMKYMFSVVRVRNIFSKPFFNRILYLFKNQIIL